MTLRHSKLSIQYKLTILNIDRGNRRLYNIIVRRGGRIKKFFLPTKIDEQSLDQTTNTEPPSQPDTIPTTNGRAAGAVATRIAGRREGTRSGSGSGSRRRYQPRRVSTSRERAAAQRRWRWGRGMAQRDDFTSAVGGPSVFPVGGNLPAVSDREEAPPLTTDISSAEGRGRPLSS